MIPVRIVFDYAIYVVARVFICVIQSLPLETCDRLAGSLAVILNDWLGVRRAVVDENLRHAYPALTQLQRRLVSRRMWKHLVLLVCEIALVARKIHRTNWHQHIRVHRKKDLLERLLSPRANVVVTAHFGNFELAGYVAGLLGFPSFTIARPLDNPFLHRYLNQYRSATGQFMLPSRGSANVAEGVLARGETLALLGDHYAGARGCWVEFFGRPASCHKGLSLFSLASGSPLIVLYSKRLDRPLQFEIGVAGIADPEDNSSSLSTVPDLTQWYNRQLEAIINDAPGQYWWLHRRWKDPRKPATKRKR